MNLSMTELAVLKCVPRQKGVSRTEVCTEAVIVVDTLSTFDYPRANATLDFLEEGGFVRRKGGLFVRTEEGCDALDSGIRQAERLINIFRATAAQEWSVAP
jgi:hypothetical protein